MRRNLNETESIELWTNNYIGHLGYILNSYPHIVLITYDYYDDATNTITSYSCEWHKIIALRKNLKVSLCVNGSISFNPDDYYKVPRTSTKVKKNEQPLG